MWLCGTDPFTRPVPMASGLPRSLGNGCRRPGTKPLNRLKGGGSSAGKKRQAGAAWTVMEMQKAAKSIWFAPVP